jgi:hypothetical protein
MMAAHADQIAAQLSLTPEQTAQFKQINQDTMNKVKALKAQPPSDKKERAKALKGIMNERQSALAKIFSPDQMKRYVPIQQADRAAMATHMMARSVQLTDDQIQKVTQINLKAIQRMAEAGKQRRRMKQGQAMKAVMEQREVELQGVLTPQQWAAYEQMKEQRQAK